jgi:hypothetical protein
MTNAESSSGLPGKDEMKQYARERKALTLEEQLALSNAAVTARIELLNAGDQPDSAKIMGTVEEKHPGTLSLLQKMENLGLSKK